MPRPADRSRRPVRRGDELELDILALGDGPDGLGRIGDYVVFVPGTLPGEQVLVHITSVTRKFARGEVLSRFTTADDRTVPLCRHYLVCGGCHRQHQYYPAQLEDKRARLQRAVDLALGAAAPAAAATIAAKPSHGQRHKVALHLRNSVRGGVEPCLHRVRSADLVRIEECPTSDPLAFDLAMRAVELLRELDHGAWDPDFAPHDLLRSVLVRATTAGDAHLIVVAREPFVPGLERILGALHDAGATTIGVNHNRGEFSQLTGPRTVIVSGPQRIEEQLDGVTYCLSPDAFFQTSPQAASALVRGVVDWLDPGPRDVVADLYCGVGLFTLPLARLARRAFGIESATAAVDDADAAAYANGLDNVTFHAGAVERVLARCGRELPRPDLVVADPPRTGLEPGVVEQLAALRPRRIAYVSCDVRALQRDLAAFATAGYRAAAAVAVDMFPHTSHLEALVCLERRAIDG